MHTAFKWPTQVYWQLKMWKAPDVALVFGTMLDGKKLKSISISFLSQKHLILPLHSHRMFIWRFKNPTDWMLLGFPLTHFKMIFLIRKVQQDQHGRHIFFIFTSLDFSVCSTEAFSAERGAREGATKVMIVVTDGESHDGDELPDALNECISRNITRYAIAVSIFCQGWTM